MRRILVICDDRWHPADVVERGLRPLREKADLSFDLVVTAKDILTPEYLENFDVILNCKSNQISGANDAPWFEEEVTEVGPAELEAFARAGGVLACIHSGTCFSETMVPDHPRFTGLNDQMIRLLGERFLGHPPRCSVTHHITRPDHPLTAGAGDFTVRDEHYQIGFVDGVPGEILMESTSERGGTMPAMYVREIGAGTLIVLTPGHTLAVWENPDFRRILENICRYGEER